MKQTNISKGVVAAAAAGLLAAGGWTVWKQSAVKVSVETDPNTGTSIKFQPASPSSGETVTPSSPIAQSPNPYSNNDLNITPSVAPAPQTTVEIFKMEPTNKGMKAVPSVIPVKEPTKSKEDNLRSAFQEMLNQKSNKTSGKLGAVSAIPKGTRLLSLKSKPDGVYINLSQEFTTGGGSNSMQARLAQVVMQATSFDKNANVWLSVEGQPLRELGGEGISVSQPMTRDSIQDMFESIRGGNN